MASPDRPPLRFQTALAAVIVAGLLARAAVIAPVAGRPDDPDNYLPLARSLAKGEGFVLNGRPTAYRPPLYPIALAPLTALLGERWLGWGIGALHLAMGGATVALTGWTARRWGLSRARALVAAAIVAFDPVLVVQSRSVMTETFSALLVAATLGALTLPGAWGAAGGGVGFGLSTLCRPSFLPALWLTAAGALLGPGGRRRRWRTSAVLAASAVATLAPWAWRNARVLGEPVWTTTHGGYTLALANNPAYYAEVLDGPPGAVWSGPSQQRWWEALNRDTRGMSEPEADRFLASSAARMLAKRPRDFARASAARLGRFWGLAPSGAVYPLPLRIATALWTAPLWAALAVGFFHKDLWISPRIAAPLLVASLSAVHAVFWTDLRMRAPIVPAIALIAAGAGGPAGRPVASADHREK